MSTSLTVKFHPSYLPGCRGLLPQRRQPVPRDRGGPPRKVHRAAPGRAEERHLHLWSTILQGEYEEHMFTPNPLKCSKG